VPIQRSATEHDEAAPNAEAAVKDAARLTLGGQLERSRLEYRARQLERVLERLRLRVRASDAGQPERAGIHRAIADFARELHEIRHQLGEPKAIVPRVSRLAKRRAAAAAERADGETVPLPPN